MINCTAVTDYPGWVTAATYHKCVIGFLGTIGNSISLWCLVQSASTNKATKFHMIFVFSVLLAICLVTLPSVSVINYISAFCKSRWFREELFISISISSSFLLQLERINFTAIAIFRCVAVWRPYMFHKLSTVTCVLVMEGVLCLYAFLPWILGLCLGYDRITYSGKYSSVRFGENSVLHKMVFTWYSVNYCLTFMATLFAYLFMIATIILQEKKLSVDQRSATTMDHVYFSIHVVILTNLVLDGPHVIVHLLSNQRLASIITHMIFFLHLIIDPMVFVGFNLHYRRAVLHRMYKCLPVAISSKLRPLEPNDDTLRMQDTPLEKCSGQPEGVYNTCVIKY
ncbi:uncharacterized protein [Cherax quadricarinatus]|uniref:uncharacterized protein n=1 Tax=Cherax quadricarinatus TaxID=27406 RepID=UPI00387ECB53